jgi:hypothetical protein
MFSVVFMFCVSFLKERNCSLRLTSGEQSCSERNALSLIPALAGGEARSNEVTREIRGAKLRGATRSAGSRRMNTAEINAARIDNRQKV